MITSAFEIANNPMKCQEMMMPRLRNKLTNNLNNKRYIKEGDGKINKTSH